MTVHYTKRAVKDLETLPPAGQRRIVEAVDRFAMSGVGDVRALCRSFTRPHFLSIVTGHAGRVRKARWVA